jgi:hypothetical protein
MPNESLAKTLNKWRMRVAALLEHAEEVPHLSAQTSRLEMLLARAHDLLAQQALLTAQKQEVSKALAEVIGEGRKVMTFLDAGVRLHYGHRSELLVAFGQQPFRGQRRVRLVGPDGRPVTSDSV